MKVTGQAKTARPNMTPIIQSLIEASNAWDVSMATALQASWLVADPEQVRQEAVRIQAIKSAEAERSKAEKRKQRKQQ